MAKETVKQRAEREAAEAIEKQVAQSKVSAAEPLAEEPDIQRSQIDFANKRNEALLKDVQGRVRKALNDLESALADTDKFIQVR